MKGAELYSIPAVAFGVRRFRGCLQWYAGFLYRCTQGLGQRFCRSGFSRLERCELRARLIRFGALRILVDERLQGLGGAVRARFVPSGGSTYGSSALGRFACLRRLRVLAGKRFIRICAIELIRLLPSALRIQRCDSCTRLIG